MTKAGKLRLPNGKGFAAARAAHCQDQTISDSFGPLMWVAALAAWRTRTAAIRRRLPVVAAMAMRDRFDASVGDLLDAAARKPV